MAKQLLPGNQNWLPYCYAALNLPLPPTVSQHVIHCYMTFNRYNSFGNLTYYLLLTFKPCLIDVALLNWSENKGPPSKILKSLSSPQPVLYFSFNLKKLRETDHVKIEDSMGKKKGLILHLNFHVRSTNNKEPSLSGLTVE